MSYTDTCSVPILPRALFFFFYSKQHCLQTKKYDVAHVVIDMYVPTKFHGFISFGFELCWLKKKKMKMNKTSPIHL